MLLIAGQARALRDLPGVLGCRMQDRGCLQTSRIRVRRNGRANGGERFGFLKSEGKYPGDQ
jgi:hypothetical protein